MCLGPALRWQRKSMCSNGRVTVNGVYSSTGRKPAPVLLYAIYFTLTALGSNPDLCCEMPAIISFVERKLSFCVSRAA